MNMPMELTLLRVILYKDTKIPLLSGGKTESNDGRRLSEEIIDLKAKTWRMGRNWYKGPRYERSQYGL